MKRIFSLWQLGFRPFFLLGTLMSATYMAIWLMIQKGIIVSVGSLSPMIWHGHEMIFGFSSAIIAGFVLTASQNWSGIRGLHSTKLKFLVGLWFLARVLILALPQIYYLQIITAIVDLSFLPVTGFFLWPYLKDVELKTERVFFLYFAMLMTANALVHSDSLGLSTGTAVQGLTLGLHTIVLVILFMGGRLIPFFTESNISKNQPKSFPIIEVASHVSAWLFLISQLFIPVSSASCVIALVAGFVNLVRLFGWYVPRIKKVPIIWILHTSYLWIVLGFFMSGLASLALVPNPLGIHAFAVGGVGAIIYGMISRVSLGHTGRRLLPSPRIVEGYILLNLAALIRVFAPIFFPQYYALEIQASGILWIIAFGIFIWKYAPMLMMQRIDNQPG